MIHPEIEELIATLKGKRAKIVVEKIIENGSVTTEELKILGYDDPRRGVCDVRDHGIPLKTFYVKSKTTGSRIGAYEFGNPDDIKNGRFGGRTAFAKSFKGRLIEELGEKNTLTGESMEARYLQIDHRIPYVVAGEDTSRKRDPKDFMLLDASTQRAKSWSCERCPNALKTRSREICQSCYWAFPDSYTHVATQPQRRSEIVWNGAEVADYEALKEKAEAEKITIQALIKRLIQGGG